MCSHETPFGHVVQDAMHSGADAFSEMFGLSTGDKDGWLHERGSAVGQELMSKMLGSLYSSNNIQAPADAASACSHAHSLPLILP